MRVMCYKCYLPRQHCWCGSITPMPTRTKFVILMHPYEFKRIKANTGRLTHLCLADSELYIGESFDGHEAVQALINDPRNLPVLLYPGREALNLSEPRPGNGPLAEFTAQLAERRLVVFLLDATWRLVRPMLRTSLSLQRLPRIMFSGAAPSRYIIKRQPEPGCLSTLEATHELLLTLDRAGLDHYALPEQMLTLFQRMQEFQIQRTAENRRLGIRRHARKEPKDGAPPPRSAAPKRRRIFPKGPPPATVV
ncbi:DTW domain protein [Lacunisphaera limnophila]|uniref:tRNA-uridine aminocarboxypropyltransferase n=1 Tax=Lacunisphaera limnophila TaxID=1838286 RepID=A0A1D8AYH4_9BACT|nr:tRNA-uridine aminocarboxypropyltransferase [Lacunisphaera limnophila]AOS45927.1 DTW domain protein [Lacunisphaera limnophila]